jgi:hypothetical protein
MSNCCVRIRRGGHFVAFQRDSKISEREEFPDILVIFGAELHQSAVPSGVITHQPSQSGVWTCAPEQHFKTELYITYNKIIVPFNNELVHEKCKLVISEQK